MVSCMNAGEVPADFENQREVREAVHAVRSNIVVRVRFWNLTSDKVDIVWINFEARPVRYALLGKREYIDITTYQGHPWVFRESNTGEVLLAIELSSVGAEPKKIYFPIRKVEHANIVVRYEIGIVSPFYSLSFLCIRNIATQIHVDPSSINSLPLPTHLLDLLKRFLISREQYRSLFNHQPLALVPGNRNQFVNDEIEVRRVLDIVAGEVGDNQQLLDDAEVFEDEHIDDE